MVSARLVIMIGTKLLRTISAASASSKKGQALGEHVLGLEVRAQPSTRAGPATGDRGIFSILGGAKVDRIVERERSIEDVRPRTGRDWPLAECGGLDRRGDLGTDRILRREDRDAHWLIGCVGRDRSRTVAMSIERDASPPHR